MYLKNKFHVFLENNMTNVPLNTDEAKQTAHQAAAAESAKQDQGNKQSQGNQPPKPAESK